MVIVATVHRSSIFRLESVLLSDNRTFYDPYASFPVTTAPGGARLSVPFRLLSMFYQWERNNRCGVIMDGSGFTLSRVLDARRGEKGGKFSRGIAPALWILFIFFFSEKSAQDSSSVHTSVVSILNISFE